MHKYMPVPVLAYGTYMCMLDGSRFTNYDLRLQVCVPIARTVALQVRYMSLTSSHHHLATPRSKFEFSKPATRTGTAPQTLLDTVRQCSAGLFAFRDRGHHVPITYNPVQIPKAVRVDFCLVRLRAVCDSANEKTVRQHRFHPSARDVLPSVTHQYSTCGASNMS